ncbi:MAG TPA: hypothetical protein VMV47_14935 [Bacteroidales bacterium]|nr:hypothetical protein [Bacteroidales bacterium]
MRNARLPFTLALFLIFFHCTTYSQANRKQEKRIPLFTGKYLIGIQFNPLFTKDYKTAGYIAGIRYGYKISEPVTLAAEASGYFLNGHISDLSQSSEEYSGLSLGAIGRYSSPARKRVQGFLELSPLYHMYLKDSTATVQYSGGTFAFYVAPGFSLFSRNRKFSFDLYYKISTQTFSNSRHTIVAYKLNYHFK